MLYLAFFKDLIITPSLEFSRISQVYSINLPLQFFCTVKRSNFQFIPLEKEYLSRVEYFDYYIKIHEVCFTHFPYPEVNLNLVKWLSQEKKLYKSSDTDAMKKYWIFLLGVKFSSTSFYLTKIFKLLILSLCIQITVVTDL